MARPPGRRAAELIGLAGWRSSSTSRPSWWSGRCCCAAWRSPARPRTRAWLGHGLRARRATRTSRPPPRRATARRWWTTPPCRARARGGHRQTDESCPQRHRRAPARQGGPTQPRRGPRTPPAMPREMVHDRPTMKALLNKTPKPMRLSLPGGKTLFLGGTRQASVREDALEHPPIKKLIEAGTLEVVDAGAAKRGGVPLPAICGLAVAASPARSEVRALAELAGARRDSRAAARGGEGQSLPSRTAPPARAPAPSRPRQRRAHRRSGAAPRSAQSARPRE